MIAAQLPSTAGSHATPSEAVFRANEEEFIEIVERYSDSAYNIAFRMLHNSADAEDAVQDAFISAYRAFPKFKGQSKVTTWLYRIVVSIRGLFRGLTSCSSIYREVDLRINLLSF